MSKSLAYKALWGACCVKDCYDSTIPPFINSFSSIESLFNIKFISNGEEVECLDFNDKDELENCVIPDCQFILFFDNTNKDKKIMRRYVMDEDDWAEGDETRTYFLAIEVVYKGVVYEIDTSLGNYYIVGNKLFDYDFIQWYMIAKYNTEITSDYNLKLIDNDFNVITLSSKQGIVINKCDYTVIGEITPPPSPKTDSSEDNEEDNEEANDSPRETITPKNIAVETVVEPDLTQSSSWW